MYFDESAERDSGGLGGSVGWREGESAAVLLPRVPGEIHIPSDCHVIVPLRLQCVCQDCVCLVDSCGSLLGGRERGLRCEV